MVSAGYAARTEKEANDIWQFVGKKLSLTTVDFQSALPVPFLCVSMHPASIEAFERPEKSLDIVKECNDGKGLGLGKLGGTSVQTESSKRYQRAWVMRHVLGFWWCHYVIASSSKQRLVEMLLLSHVLQ